MVNPICCHIIVSPVRQTEIVMHGMSMVADKRTRNFSNLSEKFPPSTDFLFYHKSFSLPMYLRFSSEDFFLHLITIGFPCLLSSIFCIGFLFSAFSSVRDIIQLCEIKFYLEGLITNHNLTSFVILEYEMTLFALKRKRT